jgi:hypothetical protein
MEIFTEVIPNWVSNHQTAVLASFAGGTGLSIFLQFFLHKLHIDSKKIAYTLIHVLSVGSAAAAFYLENVDVLPAYAGLVIIAQTVHRFAVSPYYNRYVLPYLNFLSESAAQPKVTPYAPPAPVAPSIPEPAVAQEPAFVS